MTWKEITKYEEIPLLINDPIYKLWVDKGYYGFSDHQMDQLKSLAVRAYNDSVINLVNHRDLVAKIIPRNHRSYLIAECSFDLFTDFAASYKFYKLYDLPEDWQQQIETLKNVKDLPWLGNESDNTKLVQTLKDIKTKEDKWQNTFKKELESGLTIEQIKEVYDKAKDSASQSKPITTPASDSGQNLDYKTLYENQKAAYEKLKPKYEAIKDVEGIKSQNKLLDAKLKKLETDNNNLHTENNGLKKTLEKHKPEDLKPADLPKDWKKQISEKNDWTSTFDDQKPEQVKNKLDQLDIAKSQAELERDNAKDDLEGWTVPFKEEIKAGKSPWDIKNEYEALAKHSSNPQKHLTQEQKDAINHYPEAKKKLKEWEKEFPPTRFHTPEQAGDAYRGVSQHLHEWNVAFPASKFPHKKPEDIRKDYNRLEASQKPGDHDQVKQDLETWTDAFSGPEFKGKSPSQIKGELERYKSDLLSEHRSDINRRLDDFTVNLLQKRIDRVSLDKKYDEPVDNIMGAKLTLENWETCLGNLKIVLSICAVEKAEAWSEQISRTPVDDGDRPNQIRNLTEFLSRINTFWKKTPKRAVKDNPFYLDISEKLNNYKSRAKSLDETWSKHSTTTRKTDWKNIFYEETTYSYTHVEQPPK